MKKARNYRAEAIFNRWLRERRYRRYKESFDDYRSRCDAGEVEGLGPEDFQGPEQAEQQSETAMPF